jgi:hypothetical protein
MAIRLPACPGTLSPPYPSHSSGASKVRQRADKISIMTPRMTFYRVPTDFHRPKHTFFNPDMAPRCKSAKQNPARRQVNGVASVKSLSDVGVSGLVLRLSRCEVRPGFLGAVDDAGVGWEEVKGLEEDGAFYMAHPLELSSQFLLMRTAALTPITGHYDGQASRSVATNRSRNTDTLNRPSASFSASSSATLDLQPWFPYISPYTWVPTSLEGT